MEPGDESADVAAALSKVLDTPPAPPLRVELLSGGYSWLTYLVRGSDGTAVILRVAPRGGTMEPYDPAWEAAVLDAAGGAVPAPRVMAVCDDDDVLGAPFSVQTVVPGTVLRLSDVPEGGERERYRTPFAATLGALHRDGDADALGNAATVTEAIADELVRIVGHYVGAARTRHPGFEIGLRWLYTHRPRVADRPRLCHGDFRFHNLAWTSPGELAGVLDWERAWCGDPMVDIAFTQLFSGWCAVDSEAAAVYQKAAGIAVDARRVAYGRRFEAVRSHTSGMRALRALADGRADRSELYGIGEAGQAEMWSLVRWLEAGPLDPLPVTVPLPDDHAIPVPTQRLAELRRGLPAGSPLAAHLDGLPAADAAALTRSVRALRTASLPESLAGPLRTALADRDNERAWTNAYRVLVPAAATGGSDLVPALTALGVRYTDRPLLMKGRITA